MLVEFNVYFEFLVNQEREFLKVGVHAQTDTMTSLQESIGGIGFGLGVYWSAQNTGSWVMSLVSLSIGCKGG